MQSSDNFLKRSYGDFKGKNKISPCTLKNGFYYKKAFLKKNGSKSDKKRVLTFKEARIHKFY
ncbi:hypothetical protein HMPREF1425_01318 [Helicobacter pylori GAM71Ai]|nr:hypothetical protein HMPREF1392_00326 [Helicobacter pylori GAM101Biv]EMH34032.1 hypothetical protein HMPREF1425_01318 [Helicobacter pylori GAM71Ai]EMH44780.1 hypothetical protein HMPREF1430_00277 [Helicobacter pylori GAM96Ai]EMJ39467.1 hypothetical protein HMPREF1432_01492 [Helicobacter pylori GAMchJs114i]